MLIVGNATLARLMVYVTLIRVRCLLKTGPAHFSPCFCLQIANELIIWLLLLQTHYFLTLFLTTLASKLFVAFLPRQDLLLRLLFLFWLLNLETRWSECLLIFSVFRCQFMRRLVLDRVSNALARLSLLLITLALADFESLGLTLLRHYILGWGPRPMATLTRARTAGRLATFVRFDKVWSTRRWRRAAGRSRLHILLLNIFDSFCHFVELVLQLKLFIIKSNLLPHLRRVIIFACLPLSS